MDIGTYMAEAQYSLAEVAKITEKSEKTISRWIKSGKLPAIRHGTGYLIAEEDIPIRIEPGLDRHDYIQQKLLAPDSPDGMSPAADSRRVDIQDLIGVAGLIAGGQVERKSSVDNINLMLQKHQAEVEKIIREQNELAEKYARATYKIGQLEERNRMLEEQNLKLDQKMSLLPPPEQWNATRQEVEQLRENMRVSDHAHEQQMDIYEHKVRELETKLKQAEQVEIEKKQLEEQKKAIEAQHNQIKEELDAERKKSFWKRLFGG